MHTRPRAAAIAVALAFCGISLMACKKGEAGPQHRERSPVRDVDCKDAERPRAFFYPAENRNDYGPDDPRADRCVIDVPDHVFCCPDVKRPTDR